MEKDKSGQECYAKAIENAILESLVRFGGIKSFSNGHEFSIFKDVDVVRIEINKHPHKTYPFYKIDRAVEVFISINPYYPHKK